MPGHALGRMGARLLLSPCAWAVDADHDNAREPYGELVAGRLHHAHARAPPDGGGREQRRMAHRRTVAGPQVHRLLNRHGPGRRTA